jgi:hypothetical protein
MVSDACQALVGLVERLHLKVRRGIRSMPPRCRGAKSVRMRDASQPIEARENISFHHRLRYRVALRAQLATELLGGGGALPAPKGANSFPGRRGG